MYNELAAAKGWGLTPDQWWAQSYQSRLLIMAHEMASGQMSQHDAYREERRRRRESKNKGGGGDGGLMTDSPG